MAHFRSQRQVYEVVRSRIFNFYVMSLFLQGNQLWSKIVPWRAVKGG